MFSGQSGDIKMTSANRKCSAVTGSARKIKDNVADWHNLMLRWEKLNEVGFCVAANIVNIKLSRNKQQQLVDESSSSSSSSSPPALELQDECSKLHDIVVKMVAIVTKMEHLMTSQRGIRDLEEFQFGPEGRTSPLFHTWSTEQFESSSGFLWEAFSQELKLKQAVLQEVAHTTDPDLDMVFLSCWLHQPYTPPQTRQNLEALLLETGHRPL
ncbi:cyclin-dependent kinase 2-interacting protein isoform X1 [Pleuronectes platessa]|uniref:cyclin-dependent kinase 2-interacting protein isoform X1 n=2 Tax=Pleuronectes platessa TaxID=8262 RepID=UPI00232A33A5|nr:cyclin-dependent kinase 2-interacting protein isoform X1 [Pleuronectes platessa]